MVYQVYECGQPDCRFRFPVEVASHPAGFACPRCGAATQPGSEPYTGYDVAGPAPAGASHPPVAALLDNIRSIFNVGAIFRIADGVGLSQMHLCGITATPEHPKVVKTALGAEQSVPWQYHPNALDAAQVLRAAGYQLWAIEGHPRAEPLTAVHAAPAEPIALLAGNERAGVDPALLSQCDRILHIPMQGRKRSLNVAVAFGIAAYWITMGHK